MRYGPRGRYRTGRLTANAFRLALGEWLERTRLAANLTQGQLAEELGSITQGALSRIERGDVGLDLEQFVSLAATLGVEPGDALDQVLVILRRPAARREGAGRRG